MIFNDQQLSSESLFFKIYFSLFQLIIHLYREKGVCKKNESIIKGIFKRPFTYLPITPGKYSSFWQFVFRTAQKSNE